MADVSDHIKVTIVTPFGISEEYNVRHLFAPGTEGYFGVLPGHLPFLTTLRVGEIRFDTDQGAKLWATSGGFAEVLSDHVTILAQTAEPAGQIDLDRAEAAKKRALARLSEGKPDVDTERARIALARAINRINLVTASTHD